MNLKKHFRTFEHNYKPSNFEYYFDTSDDEYNLGFQFIAVPSEYYGITIWFFKWEVGMYVNYSPL